MDIVSLGMTQVYKSVFMKNKPFSTKITLVWFLASMGSFVGVQTGLLCEAFVADGTLVGSFTSVSSEMDF